MKNEKAAQGGQIIFNQITPSYYSSVSDLSILFLEKRKYFGKKFNKKMKNYLTEVKEEFIIKNVAYSYVIFRIAMVKVKDKLIVLRDNSNRLTPVLCVYFTQSGVFLCLIKMAASCGQSARITIKITLRVQACQEISKFFPTDETEFI